MRWMRRLPLRRLRLERLRRLRRLRWLRLVYNEGRLSRLLRRKHAPTTSIDMSCYGRVMLDPAHSAFFCCLRLLRR
jgi:hypothetical protein